MLSIETLSVLVAEDRLLLTLPILDAIPRFALKKYLRFTDSKQTHWFTFTYLRFSSYLYKTLHIRQPHSPIIGPSKTRNSMRIRRLPPSIDLQLTVPAIGYIGLRNPSFTPTLTVVDRIFDYLSLSASSVLERNRSDGRTPARGGTRRPI
jgi:hypothetical protein